MSAAAAAAVALSAKHDIQAHIVSPVLKTSVFSLLKAHFLIDTFSPLFESFLLFVLLLMVAAENGFWHTPRNTLSLHLQVHNDTWAYGQLLHQEAFLLITAEILPLRSQCSFLSRT